MSWALGLWAVYPRSCGLRPHRPSSIKRQRVPLVVCAFTAPCWTALRWTYQSQVPSRESLTFSASRLLGIAGKKASNRLHRFLNLDRHLQKASDLQKARRYQSFLSSVHQATAFTIASSASNHKFPSYLFFGPGEDPSCFNLLLLFGRASISFYETRFSEQ